MGLPDFPGDPWFPWNEPDAKEDLELMGHPFSWGTQQGRMELTPGPGRTLKCYELCSAAISLGSYSSLEDAASGALGPRCCVLCSPPGPKSLRAWALIPGSPGLPGYAVTHQLHGLGNATGPLCASIALSVKQDDYVVQHCPAETVWATCVIVNFLMVTLKKVRRSRWN